MKNIRLCALGAFIVNTLLIGCNGIHGEPINRHHQDSIHHQQVHDQIMQQHQRDHEQAVEQHQRDHQQAAEHQQAQAQSGQQHNVIINNP